MELVCSKEDSVSQCLLQSSYDAVAGFRDGKRCTYWLSYDPETNVISFGQNSPYLANCLLSYKLQDNGKHLCISTCIFQEHFDHTVFNLDNEDTLLDATHLGLYITLFGGS